MTIHERIKARRKELGLTADEVAAELGVSRATVYRYESAEIANMGIDKIEPLALVLHTTPAYLMGWSEDSYDYDFDEDGRFDAIPQAQLEALKEQCNGDLEEVYRRWLQIQDFSHDEALHGDTIGDPHEAELVTLYRKLNQEGQEKLVEYADDLVSSGKYIKNDPSVLDQEQA
jgi:transcriptional regulator with XRE-family HTH domain